MVVHKAQWPKAGSVRGAAVPVWLTAAQIDGILEALARGEPSRFHAALTAAGPILRAALVEARKAQEERPMA